MAKILIVDDDPDVAASCCQVINRAGHTAVTAHNIRDGKEAFKTEKPDLVILDVTMESPDDGIVMAQDLRSEGFKTPILMLSGISRLTGYSYGADADIVPVDEFEEKPIAPSRLVMLIDKLVGR